MKNTPSFLTKKVVFIAVPVIVVALTAAAYFALAMQSTPGGSLAPKEELKVANFPYISPCQALPEKDLTGILGPMGPKGYVSEKTLKSSIGKKDIEDNTLSGNVTTSCNYYFEDSKNQALSVDVTQYADAKNAQESWNSSVSLGDGSYERQIASFEQSLAADQAAGKTNADYDQASKELLKFIKDALPRAKKEAGANVEGLDKSIIFNASRSEFIAVYKNATITLKYEFGSGDPFDESRKINADELRGVLGPVQKSFDVIFKNLDNAKLSQAPMPTLRTQQGKVGESKLLEPCELLDDKMFADIFGKPANDPIVERQSVESDVNQSRTHVDGYPILVGNDCTKRYDSKLAGGSGTDIRRGYVTLELRYAKDVKTAQAYINGVSKSLKDGEGITRIDTNADTTLYRDTNVGSLILQSSRFQTGSYVAVITMSKDDKNAESIHMPKGDFVKATNLIVKKLK